MTHLLRRSSPRFLLAALLMVLCVATSPGGQGVAALAPAAASAPGNPLAGPWGRYLVRSDEPYNAYLRATGADKAALAKIALRARVRWFGTWIPTNQVAAKIRNYITVSQAGDPTKLVQLAIFRLWPNGGEPAAKKPLNAADQEAYRAWVRAAADAIGSSRVAVVLEPDLPVALKGWNPSVRMALTRYAAQVLAHQPRTTVYIDAGDADWLPAAQAVSMLRASGIAYARGFSLGATHYYSIAAQTAYGRQLVAQLRSAGIPNRHFVIDTADNAKPFTWLQYYAMHPRGDFDNAETCTSRAQVRCVSLGHPPTWATSDPAYVDGYLWFGRPWLTRQASPFDLRRALAVTRTTPY